MVEAGIDRSAKVEEINQTGIEIKRLILEAARGQPSNHLDIDVSASGVSEFPPEPEAFKVRRYSDPIFPTLDVKVVNNTPDTILFTRAVLNVEESLPDRRPVISVWGSMLVGPEHLTLVNNGGAADDCVMRFNLVPLPQGADQDAEATSAGDGGELRTWRAQGSHRLATCWRPPQGSLPQS